MKKVVMALALVFMASALVFANNIDVGVNLNGGYSANLTLYPDAEANISVVLNHDARGEEHSGALGVGYRIGCATPWAGISSQKADASNSHVGFAFGINAEYWVGPWGASGTVAKRPNGILLSGRLVYSVLEPVTIHIGYTYDSYLSNGIVAGLGIKY